MLDIDGTLVDTNYQHALAWFRAFRAHGIVLELWRIHRHIGMGGDQLVAAVTDERTERELGDRIREAETQHYFELIVEVEPMQGSRELIEDLKRHGHKVVLASSAKPDEVEHYLDQLDARELADAWTTSPWDVEAASRAGVGTVAVRTGGFGADELRDAGAIAIFASVQELRERLDETPLA